MNSPGGVSGGFGMGGVWRGGDCFCTGGSLGGGGGDVVDALISCPLCMVLPGQSRLAEVHLWLDKLCWSVTVVNAEESVMDFETIEKVLCNDMVR
jgi:hypothetical protein